MSGEPALEKGVSGEWVVYLQQMTRDAGFWDRDPDGTFDDDLEQAVQALQDDLGLSRTGVVDADTWSALEERVPQDRGYRPADTGNGDTGTGDTGSGDTGSGDTTSQEPASSGYDPAAWNAFLRENGCLWNGEEAAWDQFRTWFVYQAGQQGLADPANGFLAYVEGQPDKAAAFAAYGVTIAAPAETTGDASSDASQAPDTSAFPEMRLGDSGEWVDYLDAMLTSRGF